METLEAGMDRVLVFDLDGTLVDSVPDLMAALNRLMAARGLARFDAAAVTAMVGDGAAALVARGFAARGAAADAAALADFLADYGANAAVATRPYPGVAETLAALREAGWGMAVCTNKPAAPARDLLAALGLAEFFTAVGGGDSFAVRKPDPGHVLAVLAAAGGDAGRAVMVGDHHNDVAAARGAGIGCIFAGWGYGAPAMAAQATAVARHVSEVPAIAGRLLADRSPGRRR
ncbi:MAG: HAD-IA family hydrolase [Rhodospirillales bacterium]|nr:HAD-IA family hydrolase [Rhodospirillales bacterium]